MDLPPGQPRLTRRTPRALVYRKAKQRRRRRIGAASAAAATNLRPPHAIDHRKVFPRLLFAILGVTTSYVSTYYILMALGLFFGTYTRHYLCRAPSPPPPPGAARAHTVHGGREMMDFRHHHRHHPMYYIPSWKRITHANPPETAASRRRRC